MGGTLCNVILLKNADVKWIDFECLWIGASADDFQFELRVVNAAIGLKGLLWRRRYIISIAN
jgi:hypothetical protein